MLIKPIGIANRINYFLKNTSTNGNLRYVKLNGKPNPSGKLGKCEYLIYPEYRMFIRHTTNYRTKESSFTDWHYNLNKDGVVENIDVLSKTISNQHGTVTYYPNGDVEVEARNYSKQIIPKKYMTEDADLTSLLPTEQIKIRNLKEDIKLIKSNPATKTSSF